jgi:hypothetical protein
MEENYADSKTEAWVAKYRNGELVTKLANDYVAYDYKPYGT